MRPLSTTLRVLLVDDHPLLRAGVKTLLEAEPDLTVAGEADDGATAVQLARELRPDVVIMDVSLPDVGGAQATRRILTESPDLRVLVLSAHEEVSFARSMMSAGAAGYMLKRSASEDLVRAVRMVAGGDMYVDPALAGALVGAGLPRISSAPAVSLSEREAEVIRLIARGHTAKEMAEALGISPRTLETYKARAMSKLGIRTRAELIRYALRSGWLRDV